VTSRPLSVFTKPSPTVYYCANNSENQISPLPSPSPSPAKTNFTETANDEEKVANMEANKADEKVTFKHWCKTLTMTKAEAVKFIEA